MARWPRASLGGLAVGGAGVLTRLVAPRRARLARRERTLAAIRNLGPREFELLLGEAYRQRRYLVATSWLAAGDAGDLMLRRAGRRTLVHGRHWRRPVVDREEVRQLCDAVELRWADAGMLVTCGRFTRAARSAARGRPVRLVDGVRLFAIVEGTRGPIASAVLAPGDSPEQD